MKIFTFITTLLLSMSTLALDPQDPKSLCERFLGGAQASCEKKISDIKPDWYVASVCNRQFDDKLFFECLLIGKNSVFSLQKLEPCDSNDLTDQQRMTCVQGAQVALGDSFQSSQVSRMPASTPSKKTKSKALAEKHSK
jgi:hypothetical protein